MQWRGVSMLLSARLDGCLFYDCPIDDLSSDNPPTWVGGCASLDGVAHVMKPDIDFTLPGPEGRAPGAGKWRSAARPSATTYSTTSHATPTTHPLMLLSALISMLCVMLLVQWGWRHRRQRRGPSV